MKSNSLLVTGAGGSAGHNVSWSLRVSRHGKNLVITGTDSDRTSLQLNSWIDYAYHLPGANNRAYLLAMNKIVKLRHVEALFPQPDSEVERISEARERLETKVFLPDKATVSKCLDKFAALESWYERGLRPKPTRLSPRDPDWQKKVRRLDFPCWIRARQGAGGLLSCLAKNDDSVNHWVKFHWEQGIRADFVAEDYLPGRDYCFMSLWNQGQLITSIVRERLSWVGHRLVGSGGTSKLNRIVHSNPVNTAAVEAIKAISDQPHGIFCVDLKENQSGKPSPTEINCRFTTNVHYLTLASIRFGHVEWNFPWIASLLAVGDQIPTCSKYDALPKDLWFTKNIDMGFTMVDNDHWKAMEV